jgi:hypothetical protein
MEIRRFLRGVQVAASRLRAAPESNHAHPNVSFMLLFEYRKRERIPTDFLYFRTQPSQIDTHPTARHSGRIHYHHQEVVKSVRRFYPLSERIEFCYATSNTQNLNVLFFFYLNWLKLTCDVRPSQFDISKT